MRHKTDRQPRPVILIAPFRSGSQSLSSLLAAYLLQKRGIRHALMPFDIRYTELRENGDLVPLSKVREYDSVESCEAEIARRLVFAKKNYGSIFFKVHPASFSRSNFEHLIEEYDWVVTTRDNLFDQFLSFAVADHFGAWSSGDRTSFDPIQVRFEQFFLFQADVLGFYELLKIKKTYWTLKLEDQMRRDYTSLSGLGPDFVSVALDNSRESETRGIPDKHKLILNLEQCRSWYRNSALNVFYPCP